MPITRCTARRTPAMTASSPTIDARARHGNAYNIFILVLTVLSLAVMVLSC